MAKKTTKDLRARVNTAFDGVFKTRGWCAEARKYLKQMGFMNSKEITVTVKFRYDGSKDHAALKRLFESWGLGIIGATKVTADISEKTLDPDFDSLSYDEAVKLLHKTANKALRDYGTSIGESVRAILEGAGEPLPPPAAVRVTVTLDGTTGDPEYIREQVQLAMSGWNRPSSTWTPEGDQEIEIKPRTKVKDVITKVNPF